MTGWQNVVRILHLSGGLRVVNNPGPEAHVLPVYRDTPRTFEFEAYPDLIRRTRSHGFTVLGCDFFEDEEELRGLREAEWRPLMQPLGAMQWPAFDVQQTWKNISHAAGQADQMAIFEKARHIATQIRICVWRLRDLSEAYHKHLFAVCQSGEFEPRPGYAGRFSEQLFFSAHAMFSELASLRDHLAMFVAREFVGINRSRVDSWPRLLEERAFKNANHPLIGKLSAHAAWLELFGDYRNLFVHNAPLSDAGGITMVKHFEMTTKLGVFPSVGLCLPREPRALRDKLRSGDVANSFEHWLGVVKNRDRAGPDALAYSHESLARMILLANEIAAASPVAPKMLHITDKDIVGEVKVSTRTIPPLEVRVPPARRK